MRLGTISLVLALVSLVASCPASAAERTWILGRDWITIHEAASMQFNGHASLQDGAIRLTSSTYSQNGSAFWKTPIDARAWETAFSFRLQSSGGETADGITFCIQNDKRGPLSLGSAGGYLGYAVSEPWNTPGISKSVAIEFDDYYNAEFSDVQEDHVGIDINGSIVSKLQAPSPVPLNAETVRVRITYRDQVLTVSMWTDPSDRTFGVTNEPSVVLKYSVDIPAILGSNTGYIGFTGATATFFQTSEITSWTFANPLPAEPDDH